MRNNIVEQQITIEANGITSEDWLYFKRAVKNLKERDNVFEFP